MLSKYTKKRVGIIGDVIIDKYKYFEAIRLSPEGPAPIVKSLSQAQNLGGSGNVAISISNLGLNVELNYVYSPFQNENQTKFIEDIAEKNSIKLKKVNSNMKNPIPLKIRYYVDNKQFMREDIEENEFNETSNFNSELIEECTSNYDYIVLSDYQKGFISAEYVKETINICNKKNIPLFIDTKISDPKFIKNAFCLKINQVEFNKLFKSNKLNKVDSLDQIKKKINIVREEFNIQNLIVTMGAKGSFLSSPKESFNVKPNKVDVVDITGAGDAYLSAIVYSFCKRDLECKLNIENKFINQEDLKIANYAASSVVSKKGTAPISKDFIKSYSENKIKKIVGFTNGCFDLLHLGHLSLLKNAKLNCDYLIVGLNSDSSIKRLKGQSRPINNEKTRYEILKSIKYIDEVIIFNEDTPINLIKQLSPDILIKGADYLEDEIVGADFVKANGGQILRVDLLENLSTTNTIKKIID